MEMTMEWEKQSDEGPIGLETKVDEGFARIDRDIRELRGEIRTEILTLRSEMNMRLDGMQRAHYAGVVAIVAALIATGAF